MLEFLLLEEWGDDSDSKWGSRLHQGLETDSNWTAFTNRLRYWGPGLILCNRRLISSHLEWKRCYCIDAYRTSTEESDIQSKTNWGGHTNIYQWSVMQFFWEVGGSTWQSALKFTFVPMLDRMGVCGGPNALYIYVFLCVIWISRMRGYLYVDYCPHISVIDSLQQVLISLNYLIYTSRFTLIAGHINDYQRDAYRLMKEGE